MPDSILDAILVAEEPLVASSGFLSVVMERVEREARSPVPDAPEPIPFPWHRAVPGFLLAVVVFGWVAVAVVRWGISGIRSESLAPAHEAISFTLVPQPLSWIALALALSLASWLFARSIAGLGRSA